MVAGMAGAIRVAPERYGCESSQGFCRDGAIMIMTLSAYGVCLRFIGFLRGSARFTGFLPGAARAALGLVAVAAFLGPTTAWRAEAVDGAAPHVLPLRHVLTGPIDAVVIRVQDGDTLLVRARIWVGQDIVVHARIAGIDTPELRGRCAREKRLAVQAKDFVSARVASGMVHLVRIRIGKYAGRVVTGVTTDDGTDLGQALLAAGLARPYHGRRRASWCRVGRSED